MSRLFLLAAIAAVIYILLQRARNQPPHQRRAEYIKLGVVVAVAAVIFLTVTGRMHWLGAAAHRPAGVAAPAGAHPDSPVSLCLPQ